jgi:hypothetical protein
MGSKISKISKQNNKEIIQHKYTKFYKYDKEYLLVSKKKLYLIYLISIQFFQGPVYDPRIDNHIQLIEFKNNINILLDKIIIFNKIISNYNNNEKSFLKYYEINYIIDLLTFCKNNYLKTYDDASNELDNNNCDIYNLSIMQCYNILSSFKLKKENYICYDILEKIQSRKIQKWYRSIKNKKY